jgi:predicted O-methyltransferase YrrM
MHQVSSSKAEGSTLMEDKYPNWFKITAQENFERFLTPLKGKFGLTFLQLGAYTGDASVWMCKNILTGDQSRLIDVDTWEGSDEEAHESIDFNEVEEIYLSRCRHLKVAPYKASTVEYLKKFNERFLFDFIYIDADHTTVGVLLDAELSWPLLKSGGIMAFDDYTWGSHLPAHLAPKLGINLFIARHQGQFETLVVNGQVWIKKL